MTRSELEAILWREGLTISQVDAILAAADSYATSQARQAIDALGPFPGIWMPADQAGAG